MNCNHYEVILINDGSKDNSLEILIEAYHLVPSELDFETKIETKKIKNIYRSTNLAFKKLIVVDKENGGKADALNVGLNIDHHPYVVCIDVDCILEKDAVLKIVKQCLEGTDKRVIATGGGVRMANQ